MNRFATVVAAAAVAAVSIAMLVGTEPPPKQSEAELGLDVALALDDGGLTYAIEVRESDGGRGWRKKVTPGCVRRAAGAPAAACRRKLSDGGLYDQGELNRFPAAEAQGGQCLPVACAVFAGDDANGDELTEAKKGNGGKIQ